MGTGCKSNLSVSSFQQWQKLTGIIIFLILLIIIYTNRYFNFKGSLLAKLSDVNKIQIAFTDIKNGVYKPKAVKNLNEINHLPSVFNKKISNVKPVVQENLLLEEEKKEEANA